MNSNFPPAHATDPRGDVVQTKSPEVSPRAREAAYSEKYLEGPLGCHVQRAIDDATVEERQRIVTELQQGQANYDAFAKELAEERERWRIAFAGAHSDSEWVKIQEQLSTERAAREKAEADCAEQTYAVAALRQKLEQTERERDEIRGQYQADMLAPHDWRQRIPALLSEWEALRAQLASVTSERDRWQEDGIRQAKTINRLAQAAEDRNAVDVARDKLYNEERDELQRKLAVAEQTIKHRDTSILVQAQVIGRWSISYQEVSKERDTLAQRVAELEKELAILRPVVSDLRWHANAICALTGRGEHDITKIVMDVIAERDKLRGYYEEIVLELGDDLALKRIRELKARCEKLEKALSDFCDYCHTQTPFSQRYENRDAMEKAKEALNQSPE